MFSEDRQGRGSRRGSWGPLLWCGDLRCIHSLAESVLCPRKPAQSEWRVQLAGPPLALGGVLRGRRPVWGVRLRGHACALCRTELWVLPEMGCVGEPW